MDEIKQKNQHDIKKEGHQEKPQQQKTGHTEAGASEKSTKIDESQKSTIKDKKDKKEDKTEKMQTGKKILESMDEKEIENLLLAKKQLEEERKLLEEKDKLLAEYEELLKRKQAEFENYRKRAQREIEENRKYATVEIVLDILNIIDDFERAVDSAKSSRDFSSLLEGIEMIQDQLHSVLKNKHNVEKIEAVGKEFDPTMHDAIMMEESPDYTEDTVVEDFQKGYKMHDRIIRPSKVKVAKAVSSEEKTNQNDNHDEKDSKTSEKGE
ncbi:MAG: nucleotide exchange factor GrpE [Spirochaetota bacterium]